MKSDLYAQIKKLETELVICRELIESHQLHLACASAMYIEDKAKELTRMMWRED